jgi:glutathione S-transferase
MSVLPVLYSFRRCPYAMRARLALAASQQPYELREILLRNKPAELTAASPKGTVPVLVLPDGSVIDESLQIMQWALQHHDPDGWLLDARQGPTQLRLIADLIATNDGLFKHHLDRYKYPHRYATGSTAGSTAELITFAVQHRDAGAAWLTRYEATLTSSPGKDWLYGQQPSLADMAILPFVRQFAHTDAAWFSAQPWPEVQAWLARFEASAAFAQVMQKHVLWQSPS